MLVLTKWSFACAIAAALGVSQSTVDVGASNVTRLGVGEFAAVAPAPSMPRAPNVHAPKSAAIGANGGLVLDFDDTSAQCAFAGTAPLRNQYAGLGVYFSGRVANNGGAVLDACSGFSVSGYSAPNFLAFNSSATYPGGGVATTPELVRFVTPKSHVELGFASPAPGTFVMIAFDSAGGVVGSFVGTLSTAMQTATIDAFGIAGVVFYTTAPTSLLVVDDLMAN